MFENAVDLVSRYTRPVHSIMRTYGSSKVFPGSATFFFVNDDGVAITCRHVAENLMHAEHLNQQYQLFIQNRFRLKNDEHYEESMKQLEFQAGYKTGSLIQMKNSFVNCFDRITGFDCHLHPQYDLAIIRFKGFTQKLYQGFASFLKENIIKQGKSLCRLGFPFPEFTNYQYNYQSDEIEWTREGNPNSPSFPIDGIVTRLISQYGRISGIEISTPGLRGQSGGPLFDRNGVIYGMQSSTRHLHLGFDLENFEIASGSSTKKITNTPFLHVGQCIHAEVIKSFLREHNIVFQESNPPV
ncbi:MAG: serine protease [Bacteroidota bacterium]